MITLWYITVQNARQFGVENEGGYDSQHVRFTNIRSMDAIGTGRTDYESLITVAEENCVRFIKLDDEELVDQGFFSRIGEKEL